MIAVAKAGARPYGVAMKKVLIDTMATIVFFTVLAGLSELLIAGLTLEQVLLTRLITIPVMIITGRPYGLYRDWVVAFGQSFRMPDFVLDILAFLSFQVPVYVTTLLIAGANWNEVATAVGSALLLMALISRPFGLFLEFARRLANVPAR